MNVIPFESAQLPVRRNKLQVSGDVVVAAEYPTISIKGRVFSVVTDGMSQVLYKPGTNPPEPVGHIDLVILRANMNNRTFYAGKFEEGQDHATPDCFSLDGVAPDASCKAPQAHSCAGCPHAVFGSSDTGRGQACKQSTRLAVAALSTLNKPHLLRVPITSVQRDKVQGTGLKDLVTTLKQRGLEYNEVVVQVGFDYMASGIKLTFRPVGVLGQDEYEAVCDLYEDSLVREIVGKPSLPVAHAVSTPAPAESVVEADDVDALLNPAPAPKAAPKRASRAKPAAAPAPSPDDDVDALLGAAPAPATQQAQHGWGGGAQVAMPTRPQNTQAELNALEGIGDLLGDFDD